MAQRIRQLYQVPADLVEDGGKEMPQIVGEHLGRLYPGPDAQGFHLLPDLLTRQAVTAFGEKNLASGGFCFSSIFKQLNAQLAGEEDGSDFPF